MEHAAARIVRVAVSVERGGTTSGTRGTECGAGLPGASSAPRCAGCPGATIEEYLWTDDEQDAGAVCWPGRVDVQSDRDVCAGGFDGMDAGTSQWISGGGG